MARRLGGQRRRRDANCASPVAASATRPAANQGSRRRPSRCLRWLRCLRDAGYDGSQCLGPRNRPSSPSAMALAAGPGAARPMPAALSYAWLSLGNLGSPKRTKSGTGPEAGVRDGVAPWKGLVDLSKGGVSRHQIEAKGWGREHSTNHHHHPRAWRDGQRRLRFDDGSKGQSTPAHSAPAITAGGHLALQCGS